MAAAAAAAAAVCEPSLRAESIEYIVVVVGPRRESQRGSSAVRVFFSFDSAKLTSSDGEQKKRREERELGKQISHRKRSEARIEVVNEGCSGFIRSEERPKKKKALVGFLCGKENWL